MNIQKNLYAILLIILLVGCESMPIENDNKSNQQQSDKSEKKGIFDSIGDNVSDFVKNRV